MRLQTEAPNAIGLEKALNVIGKHIGRLAPLKIPLQEGLGKVLAADVSARVDSPSVAASLKDGFAVISSDLERTSEKQPTKLVLTGTSAAGSPPCLAVSPGQTVRVLTGAPIPMGADAVVAEEDTSRSQGRILINQHVLPGSNVMARGCDIKASQVVAASGCWITPAILGLLAAAGISQIEVVRPPVIAVVATGDELVAPGDKLSIGELYASNMVMLDGWCRQLGFPTKNVIVGDDRNDLAETLRRVVDSADAIITSGGAWTGDRDQVAAALEDMGWEPMFSTVRMRPGKGTGFGLLGNKPVFMLPGGPSANLTAFLQIALPGLLKMAGLLQKGLPEISVQLKSDVKSRHIGWTRFVFGTIDSHTASNTFHPLVTGSRLYTMAKAEAMMAIPEGQRHIPAGTWITAQVIAPFGAMQR